MGQSQTLNPKAQHQSHAQTYPGDKLLGNRPRLTRELAECGMVGIPGRAFEELGFRA